MQSRETFRRTNREDFKLVWCHGGFFCVSSGSVNRIAFLAVSRRVFAPVMSESLNGVLSPFAVAAGRADRYQRHILQPRRLDRSRPVDELTLGRFRKQGRDGWCMREQRAASSRMKSSARLLARSETLLVEIEGSAGVLVEAQILHKARCSCADCSDSSWIRCCSWTRWHRSRRLGCCPFAAVAALLSPSLLFPALLSGIATPARSLSGLCFRVGSSFGSPIALVSFRPRSLRQGARRSCSSVVRRPREGLV